jgi:hypothetical protein
MAVVDASFVYAALGDAARAATLDSMLAPNDALHAVFPGPLLYAGPVARFRGLLAQTMGRGDEAAEHLERALEACRSVGARPAELRVATELGELLCAGRETRRGRALLEEARAGAEALGMASLAARAARGLEQTK